jgi:O-antigen ligase
MGIWKASFQSILKHPILGVGIGNYPVVLNEDISAAKKGASAHNLYLDVASEMGILGLIVLLMIFFEIFKLCWKKFKEDKYILVFFFFLVWILIYNLFDVVLLNDKVLLLFMVAMALVYPIENHEKSISIS